MIRSILIIGFLVTACTNTTQESNSIARELHGKIPILIDSDANNEIDDQHAIAYALLDTTSFNVVGITVNNTYNGNGIENQYEEAVRVARLCGRYPEIPVIKGAQDDYKTIRPFIGNPDYDGKKAVDFIIDQARKLRQEKLVLMPIGKLTNIALALEVAPDIVDKVKVVWLGSNYPEPGEYNLDNDTTAVNPVINSGVEFEMVTVRYGEPSGTAAVTITQEEIETRMPNKGPGIDKEVIGRHNGRFTTFGDYSVSLFRNTQMYGDPPSRSLFDMAAIAIVKNPSWAEQNSIDAPHLTGNAWTGNSENGNKIIIWENFDRDKIIEDLFNVIDQY